MKITTWNVNGYRAILKKGLVDWILSSKPDVLCLQEIKVRPDQLSDLDREIPGFISLWNPAEKPGYSGVATFVINAPEEFRFGMGDSRFDCEGRILVTRHPGFLLFNIYFPNGQRGGERLAYKLDFYSALLNWCDRLHSQGESIVITGDFNTAHREIDLARPKQNATTSGFLPEERIWIDHFMEHGFIDSYRYLYPDKIEYTWWTYITNAREKNIGWRIDYFLVSSKLVHIVNDVIIHKDTVGSDHCPVTLVLNG